MASGLHFLQTADITLSDPWVPWAPIGDPFATDSFRGTFDGGNRTIDGLSLTGSLYQGLFGVVQGGTITNVTLANPNVNALGTEIGPVAGSVWGGVIDNVHVIGGTVQGGEHVGGLIGRTGPQSGGSVVVRNSSSTASVTASVRSMTTPYALTTSGWNAGGLIGSARGFTQVTGSSAAGSVQAVSRAGGLIGEVEPVNDRFVSMTCDAMTTVSIENSFALGSATATASESAGGVVGLLRSEPLCVPILTNVYSTGRATSITDTADRGIAGAVFGIDGTTAPDVTGAYWDTQTTTMTTAWPAPPTVSGATGKTTAQMKDIDTYTGWNIAATWSPTTIWVICSTANGGYPFLAGFFSAADAPCIDLPEPPSTPTATAGDAQATITASAGGGGTTANILITATPSSSTCTITGTSGSCTITGLTNGTAYTFTATGRNAAGSGAASASSTAVTPTSPPVPPEPSPAPTAAPTPTATPAPVPSVAPPVDTPPIPPDATQQAVETVQQLTPSQVQELSATQMAALPPAAFAVMTPAQIRALQPRQVTSLTQEQIREISPESLQAMKPRTLARLRLTQIRSLTPEQAAALRPEQIRKLGPMKQRSVNRKR